MGKQEIDLMWKLSIHDLISYNYDTVYVQFWQKVMENRSFFLSWAKEKVWIFSGINGHGWWSTLKLKKGSWKSPKMLLPGSIRNTFSHPPYSLNLNPVPKFSYFFSLWKKNLRGRRFSIIEEMKTAVKQIICRTRTLEFFKTLIKVMMNIPMFFLWLFGIIK